MNFRPLQVRVFVRRTDETETVRGGIIIPDTAKEKPQQGEVSRRVEGKRLEDGAILPLEARPGDRILFGKYSATEIKLDGEELLILKEDEILGITEATKKTKKAGK